MQNELRVKAYGKSVIGAREINQDSFLTGASHGIFAVADGVGGGLRGEVASQMAVENLAKYKGTPSQLRSVIDRLQQEIMSEAISSLGEPLMGTTLTAVQVDRDEATLCHVGDSRLYIYIDGCLRQLSRDHEIFDDSVQSMVLNSYLGMPTDTYPFCVQEERFFLRSGNRLILCSDGLYRQLPENRIIALMREHAQKPDLLVEKLCSEAVEASEYSDNVTVVYVEID